MRDKLKAKGTVHFFMYDEKGTVKLDRTQPNLVVDTGLNWIIDRMLDTGTLMSHMSIGTGTVTPVAGNTTLGTPTPGEVRRAYDSATDNGDSTITWQATFPTDVGNTNGWSAAITEAGLFNAGAAGVMLARTTFSEINKGDNDTLVITWTIDLNAA